MGLNGRWVSDGSRDVEAPRDKEQMGTGFGIPLLQSQEKIPKAWGKKKNQWDPSGVLGKEKG